MTKRINLQRSQEGYLMPYVSAYIGAQAQNKFNAKIITSLGTLDSQVSATATYWLLRYTHYCENSRSVTVALAAHI
jgi:hypothetical protein